MDNTSNQPHNDDYPNRSLPLLVAADSSMDDEQPTGISTGDLKTGLFASTMTAPELPAEGDIAAVLPKVAHPVPASHTCSDNAVTCSVNAVTSTLPSQPSLQQCTSVYDLLAGVPHVRESPLFQETRVDQNKDVWIVYKCPSPSEIYVDMSVGTMKQMLDLIGDETRVAWKRGKTGSTDAFRSLLNASPSFPDHIFPSFDQAFRYLPGAQSRHVNRRDHHRTGLMIGKVGYCAAAKSSSCLTKIVVGWTEEAIDSFAKLGSEVDGRFDETRIPFVCRVWRSDKEDEKWYPNFIDDVITEVCGCVHKMNEPYGSLRGSERRAAGQAMTSQKMAPSQFQKDQLSLLEAGQYHSKKMSHHPSRSVLNNAKSEQTNQTTYQDNGFGRSHKNNLENCLVALRKTEKDDQELRVITQDADTSYLGFSQALVASSRQFALNMFTLSQLRIYRVLASKGFLVLNFDGTGNLLTFNIANGDLTNNPIQHHMLMANTKYIYGKEDPKGLAKINRSMKDKMPPTLLLERISDKNTAVELKETLEEFLDGVKGLYLPEFPFQPPILMLTDCAPQLQSATMFTFNKSAVGLDFDLSSKTKQNARILYCNVVGPHLLYFESQIHALETSGAGTVGISTRSLAVAVKKRKIAALVRSRLAELGFVTLQKVCRSHVYRAAVKWGKGKNQFLGKLFSTVMDWATKVDTLAEAVCILSVYIAALQVEDCTVSRRYYEMSKSTDKATRRLMMDSIRKEIDQCGCLVDSFIKTNTLELLREHETFESTNKKSAYNTEVWPDYHQSISEKAKRDILPSLVKVYAMAQTKNNDTENCSDEMKVYVVLGRRQHSGIHASTTSDKPTTADSSTHVLETVYVSELLPGIKDGGSTSCRFPIPDAKTATTYVLGGWAPTIVTWARGSVHLLESDVGFPIEGSNQYAEASFRTMKLHQTAKQACRDLPVYISERHREVQASARLFARNYGLMEQESNSKKRYSSVLSPPLCPIDTVAAQTEFASGGTSMSECDSKMPVMPHQNVPLLPQKRSADCIEKQEELSQGDAANKEEHETTTFNRGNQHTSAEERHEEYLQVLSRKYLSLAKDPFAVRLKNNERVPVKPLYQAIKHITGREVAKFKYSKFLAWCNGKGQVKCKAHETKWIQEFASYKGDQRFDPDTLKDSK